MGFNRSGGMGMNIRTFGNIISDYVKGVIILDSEQVVLWRNEIYKELFNGEEILGNKLNVIFSVNFSEISKENKIIKNLSGKKYSIKCRDIKEKEESYTLILVDEITNFKNNNVKLHCLERIIDSIEDGIIISDYEGRVVLYNNSQEKMEDLESKKVVGKYLWECYNSKPELSEHRKVYKTNVPIVNKYEAHAYKDGIPKYVSYSTYPIIKDGETIAVYTISKNESRLQTLLHDTLEQKRKLYSKNDYRSENHQNNGTRYTFSDIVGDSSAMTNLIKEAESIALLKSPVLIVGETGTGKEVFAQSIHNYSTNREFPFVDINCSAIPENLLESILFGSVKGAYTGAADQAGLFEEARNGTLFLDEINSMPISMQAKLLRVLQEKKVRRVGALNTIPISCRVISAVNEDPQKIIKEGRFRQDLYYRIAGTSLYIPSLRERKEDIISTSMFFINKYNKLLSRNIKAISKELKEMMFRYTWPGNIRELEHIIESIMVRASDKETELSISDMPHYLRDNFIGSIASDSVQENKSSLSNVLRDVEKRLILESLEANNWNLSRTARDLGIIRQSLEYRIKKLKIERK
jgi:arginine utilization regulatory protein